MLFYRWDKGPKLRIDQYVRWKPLGTVFVFDFGYWFLIQWLWVKLLSGVVWLKGTPLVTGTNTRRTYISRHNFLCF